MKKVICIVCAFVMLFCTNAFAAGFEMEDNPDYKTPVKPDGRYSDTSKCIDYNDKSLKENENFKSYDCGTDYTLSWITGPSGEEGDFAPFMESAAASTGQLANLYLFHLGTDGKMKDGGGTVIAEYDLKVNTATDRFIVADTRLWNPDKGDESRIFLDETGHVRGTDFTYTAGEWMHIKMEVCYETQLWNVWIDGEKAVDNMPVASRYSWDKDTRFSFFVSQVGQREEGEAKAGFAIDNFIAYAIGKDISELVSVEISDADKTTAFSLDNVPVNPQIELSFDSALDSSLINSENIIISNQMGTAVECDYEINGSDVVIIPKNELDFETDYRIKISDELRASYNSYRPLSGKLSFTTGNDRDFVIQGAELTDSEVNVTLVNNIGAAADAGVIVAVYNSSNGLKTVLRKNVSLSEGENLFEKLAQIKCELSEGDKVKLFVTYADDYAAVDEEVLK